MRKMTTRRKKNPAIGIAIALGVVVVAAAAFLLFNPFRSAAPTEEAEQPATPDALLSAYFAHVAAGEYEALYDLIDAESRAAITREDFLARHDGIYSGIEAQNIAVTVGETTDDEAGEGKIVAYTVRMDTVAGEISYANEALFTLDESKTYRLRWDSGAIFPGLGLEDRVRVRTTAAERGCIYDRHGNLLAGPGVASAVGFVPGKMRPEGETDAPAATDAATPIPTPTTDPNAPARYNAEDIAKIADLLETTPESIERKLSASYVREDTFVLLKTVPKEAYELKEELLSVPGILISDTTVRHYPLGEAAAHLVGYIQGINAEELEARPGQGYHANSQLGKAGLEQIYEERLRAVDGCEIVIVDSAGNVKESLAKKEAVDGTDLSVTIDSAAQTRLYDLFQQDKSCSVAMNPRTGEVLALVSTPTYDANDFVLGMSSARWTALNEDPNMPLYNRFKAALCPGSTMKAITAAVGLDAAAIAPTDDLGHSGLTWRKDDSWGGYYITTTREYDEPANVENALVYSDNIFFGKLAMAIGAEPFARRLIDLGFEGRIPFEYGLYSSIVSTTETFTSEIQLADSGFGQGEILANPVHLAALYAAFVNDGDLLTPRLLYAGSTEPTLWKERAFSPETARVVLDGLVQVIERGTGGDAQIPGALLAGKTGTAEIKQAKDDETGTELGWFVLMTADPDAANPLLVVSMVEDVKDRGGSHYLIPLVKQLFDTTP